MTLERQRIGRLYKMLEEAEEKGDIDNIALFRWVIFELEKLYR